MKILSRRKLTAENLKDFNGKNLLAVKRNLRLPLLKAFDVYKSNVYYGVTSESADAHARIIAWYGDLLDLREDALANVPSEIKKYLN